MKPIQNSLFFKLDVALCNEFYRQPETTIEFYGINILSHSHQTTQDAETYEIYYDINIFLHSHLAPQDAVLRLITNELYLICMLLITDDACS